MWKYNSCAAFPACWGENWIHKYNIYIVHGSNRRLENVYNSVTS